MKRPTSKFTHITNLALIVTVHDILAELARHEQVLIGTDIERLIYFSRTYAVMNRTIHEVCLEGYFSHPVIMGQLQIAFAHTYFETLNTYARTGRLPPRWQIATNHRLIRLQPAGVSLLLGVSAHIQCDAAASLRRIAVEPDLLANDYLRVNQLLFQSSDKIARSYSPNPRLQLVREIARKLLVVPICLSIFRLRRKAWGEYQIEVNPASAVLNHCLETSRYPQGNKALQELEI